MHHKRKRPKNARAGCLMCKPWKANGGTHQTLLEKNSDHKRRTFAERDITEFRNKDRE